MNCIGPPKGMSPFYFRQTFTGKWIDFETPYQYFLWFLFAVKLDCLVT